MEGYNRPPRRDYLSVKRYFEQVPPVCNVESYIFREEDIITLKPGRESAWLDDFVERAVQKLSCKIIRVGFLYLNAIPSLTLKLRNYSVHRSVLYPSD